MQLRDEEVNAVYQRLDEEVATSRAKLAGLERKKAQLMNVNKIGAVKFPSLSLLYEREGQLARLELERDLARKVYGESQD